MTKRHYPADQRGKTGGHCECPLLVIMFGALFVGAMQEPVTQTPTGGHNRAIQ